MYSSILFVFWLPVFVIHIHFTVEALLTRPNRYGPERYALETVNTSSRLSLWLAFFGRPFIQTSISPHTQHTKTAEKKHKNWKCLNRKLLCVFLLGLLSISLHPKMCLQERTSCKMVWTEHFPFLWIINIDLKSLERIFLEQFVEQFSWKNYFEVYILGPF